VNPQPFGYYTLINRINIGGMAEVFKACYYQENGIPAFAAIKRILPNLAQDPTFVEMFISEARTAQKLQHKHIAQIIELGEEAGEYYISMEYVSGRDLLFLRHHLKERGTFFSPGLSAYVIASMAEALDYAHSMCDSQGQHLEIIHRDISPQNILISYEGEVKLIDFGIAKAKDRSYENTRAGVLKGKFGYMAPEQIQGKKITHQIDIFALGIVLYELLTNQRLFMGDSDLETLELVRLAKIQPPNTINEWIPPALNQITMNALAADPKQRYQTAGDLAKDLRLFIAHESPMSNQTALKQWMYQEFATYIAHEKAQNNHFLEQLKQFMQNDDHENMESETIALPPNIIELIQAHGESKVAQVAHPSSSSSDTNPLGIDVNSEAQDTEPPEEITAESYISSSDLNELQQLSIQNQIENDEATRKVSASTFELLKKEVASQRDLENTIQASAQPLFPFESIDQDISEINDHELMELLDVSFDDLDDLDLSEESLVSKGNLENDQNSIQFHEQHTPVSHLIKTKEPQHNIMKAPYTTSAPVPHINSSKPVSQHYVETQQNHVLLEKEQGLNFRQENSRLAVQSQHTRSPSAMTLNSNFDIRHISKSKVKKSKFKKALLLIMLLIIGSVGIIAYYLFLESDSHDLQIYTQPADQLTINLDQKQIGASLKTPYLLKVKGEQILTISRPGYQDWSLLLDDSTSPLPNQLTVRLQPKLPAVNLYIGSSPAGAEVWINGIQTGVTPFKSSFQPFTQDEIQVTVKLAGYTAVSEIFSPQKHKHSMWAALKR
jgi:serine/threonine protein kinase